MNNTCHIHQPVCLMEATGEDAFDFLQSQFSNDLRNASGTEPRYGFWLNNKGRIQGDSLVFHRDTNHFLIVSRYTDGHALKNFLETRIIADEVELNLPLSPQILISTLGREPSSTTLYPWFPDPTLPHPGASCLAKADEVDAILASESLHTISDDVLEKSLLLNRMLRIPVDLPVSVFPQELGLDAYVSYQKGCFLGQEVMARLRYQGQVRRSLQLYQTSHAPMLPLPGSALTAHNKKAGVVMRAMTDGEQSYLLALATTPSQDSVEDENQQHWTAYTD